MRRIVAPDRLGPEDRPRFGGKSVALPCVTGVPAVTRRVRTGDFLTVDGYLGIVTRHDSGERSRSERLPER